MSRVQDAQNLKRMLVLGLGSELGQRRVAPARAVLARCGGAPRWCVCCFGVLSLVFIRLLCVSGFDVCRSLARRIHHSRPCRVIAA